MVSLSRRCENTTRIRNRNKKNGVIGVIGGRDRCLALVLDQVREERHLLRCKRRLLMYAIL